jgi:hypothetical protein
VANEIAYKSEPGLKTGYRLASHKRVIIDDVGNRFENRHVVQLVPPSEDWRKAHVYSIHLTPEQMRRWPCQPSVTWVVAMNDRAVESYIAKRYGRIAQQAKGMAKSALSKLAHKISALDRDDSNATPHAQRVAWRETSVRERVAGDKYVLDIRDELMFAKLAVKGGDFGIQLAMKKAANKVAGYIQHTCKKILLPGELPTPFPEIRRRRSA